MKEPEIHWFPGHMKKARNAIETKLANCDGVIEIGDSRAPFSSFPDYLDKITSGKAKVFLLSKADIADPVQFERARKKYEKKGIKVFGYDLRNKASVHPIVKYLSSLKTSKDNRYERLGFPVPSKTYIVLGIPNVGKSTLINSLSGAKKAAVENRPGKTRDEPLIKVTDKVFIYDAPGILEPNYEDKNVIAKLALLGSVKQEAIPLLALSDYLLDLTRERYGLLYESRYGVKLDGTDEDFFTAVAIRRGMVLKGSLPDVDRARILVLTDFRNGLIGPMSLDTLDEEE